MTFLSLLEILSVVIAMVQSRPTKMVVAIHATMFEKLTRIWDGWSGKIRLHSKRCA